MNWMKPILFSLGWFDFRTADLFLIIGLFLGLFVYWRKVKYDSEYNEAEAFDGFLISLLIGWLAGRGAYILLNFESFGLNPLNWINIFGFPGMNIIVAMIVSGLYLKNWAVRQNFDAFKLLDFWATAACLSICFYYLGFFFSGLGFGNETNWVVGFTPPGMVTKMQPIQLYLAVFYLLLFIYLVRVEYKYRTFDWYRNGRSSAESGFIVAMFVIWSGLVGLGMLFLSSGTIIISGINVEWGVQGIIFVWGLLILWLRSGRKIGGKRRKKKPTVKFAVETANRLNEKESFETESETEQKIIQATSRTKKPKQLDLQGGIRKQGLITNISSSPERVSQENRRKESTSKKKSGKEIDLRKIATKDLSKTSKTAPKSEVRPVKIKIQPVNPVRPKVRPKPLKQVENSAVQASDVRKQKPKTGTTKPKTKSKPKKEVYRFKLK